MFKYIIGLLIVAQLFSMAPKINNNEFNIGINENTISSVLQIGLRASKNACSIIQSLLDSAIYNLDNSGTIFPNNESFKKRNTEIYNEI